MVTTGAGSARAIARAWIRRPATAPSQPSGKNSTHNGPRLKRLNQAVVPCLTRGLNIGANLRMRKQSFRRLMPRTANCFAKSPSSCLLPASLPWQAGISKFPHPLADADGRRDARIVPSGRSRVPSPPTGEGQGEGGLLLPAGGTQPSGTGTIRPPPAPAAPTPAGSCAGDGRSRHGPAAASACSACHSPCCAPSRKAEVQAEVPRMIRSRVTLAI